MSILYLVLLFSQVISKRLHPHHIHIGGHVIDTTITPSRQVRPLSKVNIQHDAHKHYFIHLDAGVTEFDVHSHFCPVWDCSTYLHTNSWLVYSNEHSLTKFAIQQDKHLLWHEEITAEHKVPIGFASRVNNWHQAKAAPKTSPLRQQLNVALPLILQIHLAQPPQASISETLERWTSELVELTAHKPELFGHPKQHETDNGPILFVRTDNQQHLNQLVSYFASQPEVHYVDLRDTNAASMLDTTSYVLQGGIYNDRPVWNNGIDGSGEIINVADTGLDWQRCFFKDSSFPTPDNTADDPLNTFHYYDCIKDGFSTICGPLDKHRDMNYTHRKVVMLTAFPGGTRFYRTALGMSTLTDDLTDQVDGHGTHVASCALGLKEGLVGSSAEQLGDVAKQPSTGMAPGAKLWFSDIAPNFSWWVTNIGNQKVPPIPPSPPTILLDDCHQTSLRTLNKVWGNQGYPADHADGAFCGISSNSWGTFPYTDEFGCPDIAEDAYHDTTWQTDRAIFNKVQNDTDSILIIFAAGNEADRCGERTIAHPAQAKNVLTVGATIGNRSRMADFSSFGPTWDGRYKPEVVAPGERIRGCKSEYEDQLDFTQICDTAIQSGTSMATPSVAGSAALLRQYLRRGYIVDGKTPNLGNSIAFPTSALLKSLLMLSADPIVTQRDFVSGFQLGEADEIPDHRQGLGRVNLGNIMFPREGRVWFNTDWPLPNNLPNFVSTQDPDTVEYEHHFCFKATGGTRPLKILLYWHDPEASGAGSKEQALVNDLDLLVWNDKEKKKGNMRERYDELNNFEQVTFNDATEDSKFRIVVTLSPIQKKIVKGKFKGGKIVLPFTLAITGNFDDPVYVPNLNAEPFDTCPEKKCPCEDQFCEYSEEKLAHQCVCPPPYYHLDCSVRPDLLDLERGCRDAQCPGGCFVENNCRCFRDSVNGFWQEVPRTVLGDCQDCSTELDAVLLQTQERESRKDCAKVLVPTPFQHSALANGEQYCVVKCECRGNWEGILCNKCKTGWGGDQCTCKQTTTTTTTVITCSDHGICTNLGCRCHDDNVRGHWRGSETVDTQQHYQSCDVCKKGWSGPKCLCPYDEGTKKTCSDHGKCDPTSGLCVCDRTDEKGHFVRGDDLDCQKCVDGWGPVPQPATGKGCRAHIEGCTKETRGIVNWRGCICLSNPDNGYWGPDLKGKHWTEPTPTTEVDEENHKLPQTQFSRDCNRCAPDFYGPGASETEHCKCARKGKTAAASQQNEEDLCDNGECTESGCVCHMTDRLGFWRPNFFGKTEAEKRLCSLCYENFWGPGRSNSTSCGCYAAAGEPECSGHGTCRASTNCECDSSFEAGFYQPSSASDPKWASIFAQYNIPIPPPDRGTDGTSQQTPSHNRDCPRCQDDDPTVHNPDCKCENARCNGHGTCRPTGCECKSTDATGHWFSQVYTQWLLNNPGKTIDEKPFYDILNPEGPDCLACAPGWSSPNIGCTCFEGSCTSFNIKSFPACDKNDPEDGIDPCRLQWNGENSLPDIKIYYEEGDVAPPEEDITLVFATAQKPSSAPAAWQHLEGTTFTLEVVEPRDLDAAGLLHKQRVLNSLKKRGNFQTQQEGETPTAPQNTTGQGGEQQQQSTAAVTVFTSFIELRLRYDDSIEYNNTETGEKLRIDYTSKTNPPVLYKRLAGGSWVRADETCPPNTRLAPRDTINPSRSQITTRICEVGDKTTFALFVQPIDTDPFLPMIIIGIIMVVIILIIVVIAVVILRMMLRQARRERDAKEKVIKYITERSGKSTLRHRLKLKAHESFTPELAAERFLMKTQKARRAVKRYMTMHNITDESTRVVDPLECNAEDASSAVDMLTVNKLSSKVLEFSEGDKDMLDACRKIRGMFTMDKYSREWHLKESTLPEHLQRLVKLQMENERLKRLLISIKRANLPT